jgi:hypothetical protein
MSNDKTYNGWTNRETWLTALWIDNDYGLYSCVTEQARELAEDAELEEEATSEDYLMTITGKLGSFIKDLIEEMQPEVTGLFADLINGALAEVEYYEIASHFIQTEIENRKAA